MCAFTLEHPCFEAFAHNPRVERRTLGSKHQLAEVAHNLYASLRSFDLLQPDDARVSVIFAEVFSEAEIGRAIMNRLKKAAGYSVLRENAGETDQNNDYVSGAEESDTNSSISRNAESKKRCRCSNSPEEGGLRSLVDQDAESCSLKKIKSLAE